MICLVSFAGYLQYDELANLKESDLAILEDHLELYKESSKTNQYSDGAWVVVACNHSELCPVRMLERYIVLASIGDDAEKFLFRCILNMKLGARLGHQVGSVTRECAGNAAELAWISPDMAS